MLGARLEEHALHEHSFLQGVDSHLDDFLAQGREVLDNLVDQRAVLKGTQRRLRDAANTLGLSRDVISWIDRRRCVQYLLFVAERCNFFLPRIPRD
jgi:golgi SNAP receptor complex member 2